MTWVKELADATRDVEPAPLSNNEVASPAKGSVTHQRAGTAPLPHQQTFLVHLHHPNAITSHQNIAAACKANV